MRCKGINLRLYAVTDRAWSGERTLYEQAEEALRGGVTLLQLREKELCEEDFLKEALEFRELCGRYHVPLLINDNVELALRCGADGVHVGQQDMAAGDVRKRIGDSRILGVSAQTVEQALAAERAGADYLGVGAVFSTSTKLDADAVSLETLRQICSSVSIPVCAIGGITMENMPLLRGTGIGGVALVSAIFGCEGIEARCRDLRELSERLLGGDEAAGTVRSGT